MSKYTFSTKGKIEVALKFTLIFGIPIAILVFISRFVYLYYITWMPILWLIYHLIDEIMYVCTAIFFVDEKELIVKSVLNTIVKKISWSDVSDIKVNRFRSRISKIAIFTKGEKKPFILKNTIDNWEKLFEIILSNTKRIKSEKLQTKS